MKLLVTGGAGFIGSNFIHYWLKQHPENNIVNLDVLSYAGNLENHVSIEGNEHYRFVKGDITDKDVVFPLVQDADIVVHFAAETHVDRSILDPAVFVRTNVMGTQVLLEAVKEYGTRFHHISTDEVFGALGPNDVPFNEHTKYDPRSPYSASKAGADHLVRAYFHTYGIPMTISNCSNNYGPYMFPEKMMPLFISNLLEDKKVPVYGDGLQVRDWIHVDDHARGVEAILEKGKIGETYCLGGNAEKKNIDIVKLLLTYLGKDESYIEYVKDRPGHDRRYAIDFSKATRELGWEPHISFEQGLKEMVEWYVSNQEWVARCKSGDYQAYYDEWYNKTLKK
ncbi:MAG: dTDP-glucose 4,6-dehydratase [Candidatus Magasanikbacteria bacterium CG_4_9_14_0_2_um_filter_41_10]|uniref:dTDP-glucose 4,6-dehydratase n=1 Tax=Candidatus Magasanikbacteria bacterium CG_4_10_14_0_2_um_filter_41_31 TaxID=1974639 RepID=A0A2M7V4R6_9BACT|nr:MAG: dTDP-glucose 4,6-dehydratase [Candidatus Magasanikbacteria bacterium CG1_02_41_34]PIZ93522.1 MAG: dTDP-glucose 4,6-dehydratase [Candidatus Magasanikbacteria bacterium CG_4_10_14_0_2_um_filter_41_31]PJC53947.1 MAG: dTDP-glucose 4,6-dehydratase [Candidatus Magasanikbacteria bacterium CG_4_9_14_0_2_um_filter_41_10]